MLFSRRKDILPLIGEFIEISHEIVIKCIKHLIIQSKIYDEKSLQYVRSKIGAFEALWPASSCVWGAALKTGDAKRFCERAVHESALRLAVTSPLTMGVANEIFSLSQSAENTFANGVRLMVEGVFPDLIFHAEEFPAIGSQFVGSLNMASHIVGRYKIAW
jgi:hypothetical protein